MSNKNLSYIYAGLAVLLWSTAATSFKITLKLFDYHLASVLMIASWVSFFSLFILSMNKKIKPSFFSKSYMTQSAFMGLLNPFIYYLVLFRAYSLLPGQEAQPLNFVWPIVLTLMSVVFLKESLTLKECLSIGISFIGVLVISTRGEIWPIRISNPLGAGMALGSTLIWSFYWILNLQDKRDVTVKLLMNFFFGSLYITLYVIITNSWQWAGWQGVLGCLWIGLFEMGITFFCWLKALELASNTARMSQLIYLTPFLSLVLLVTVADEEIQFSSIIGLLLIVTGILIENIYRSRKSV